MKKFILNLIPLACAAVACNTVSIEQPVQYGQLGVALSEPTVELVTKAPTSLLQTDTEAANYTVRVYDTSGAEKYESSYSSFVAQKLPLGTYYVTAENCTEDDAENAEDGKGKMRLFGRSTDITLSAAQLSQTATVNCTVANARVSVKFDESVKNRFSGLKVTLSGGTKRDEVIGINETESNVETVYWFNPSELTYTISGTFTASGMNQTVSIEKKISLEAKNNVQLVVKVNLENGQLMPSLIFDTQIDDLTEFLEEFNPYK
jgi:hypothetical protein